MEQLDIQIMDFSAQGFSCSQIIFLLAEEVHQERNPHLIKAADGFTNGFHCLKTCGILTACCGLLSLYLGKGIERDASPIFQEAVSSFVFWFETTYGDMDCKTLLSNHNNENNQFCGQAIKESFIKCMELLNESNVDPYSLSAT